MSDKEVLEDLNNELNALNIKIALAKRGLNNNSSLVAWGIFKRDISNTQGKLVHHIEKLFYK